MKHRSGVEVSHPRNPSILSRKNLELLSNLLGEEHLGSGGIVRRANLNEFPLSSVQQRLWLLDRLEGGVHYNDHFNLRLTGPLDATALEKSIAEIVNRHEAMRSRFEEMNGEPHQTIAPRTMLRLPRTDLSTMPEPQRTDHATRLAVEEARKPFDLKTGPLWRFRLVRLSPNEHVLLITAHHVAIDGWSRGVFLRELRTAYSAFKIGAPSPLSDLPIQYADYAAWQKQWLDSEPIARQVHYWRERLAGAPGFVELPADRIRPTVQTFRGARHWLTISPEMTARLKELCRRQRVTLFMALLTILQMLIYRYTGQEDILIGTPAANRTRKQLEDLIGCFLNTLTLRGRISEHATVRELLTAARSITVEALSHQDLPFEKLIDALQPERNESYTPLFQIFFILQNTPAADLQVDDLHISGLEIDNGTAKFDLTLSLQEKDGAITGWIEYSTDLFDADRIQRMDGHFQRLIEQAAANPDARVSELELLTPDERNLAIVRWNNSRASIPRACVHELFDRQARREPNRVAIEFESERWTYEQLNNHAELVSDALRLAGIGPGALVATCMNRSPHMAAAVLGILKSGGAYVPLDPLFPRDRLAFMIEDAQPRVTVTEQRLLSFIQTLTRTPAICVDKLPEVDVATEGSLLPASDPHSLAYVIFTSGSTGKPKGVQIEHRSVVNFLESMRREPGLDRDDVFVAVTTFSFDIAALELFLPLVVGARVVLASRETAADGHRLRRLLERSGATVMQATPATWQLLLAAGWKGHSSFKILCGGESWDDELASQLLNCCGSLWNMYGPTETTIWSSAGRVLPGRPPRIEGPLANTQFYILDRFGRLAPVGVPGELCIGGEGVARGYWNRPELDAIRFIPNSFWGEPSALLYRTGDLVCYSSDGSIEFLGRMDHQVKLRGFRIELGEIESLLSQHPHIRQTVAVVRQDAAEPRIAVYFTTDAGGRVDPAELRQWLRSKLPDYMIPADFVVLDELPLTPNGKVDRTALPAPTRAVEIASSRTAPRDALEFQLVRIWQSVLQTPSIAVTDNFFDLGGHSLTAVRLFAELRKQTGRDLPLALLFHAPTVEQLAQVLRNDGWAPSWSSLVPIQPGGSKPPFFCVHGGGGGVLLFRDLARRLGPDYPFYGLQSKHSESRGAKLTTIHEMASHYLNEVRQLQPNGPYYLGGFCMGGTVAYEMAQQLRRQGETIGLLALFETYNHNGVAPLAPFFSTLWQKTLFHCSNISRLPFHERMAYIEAKLRAARVRELSKLSAKLGKKSEALLERINEEAGYAYRPEFYSGELTLFQPANNYRFLDKPHLGWSGFTSSLEIVELPICPGGLFVEPYVRIVAEKLKWCIDRAEGHPLEARALAR